MFTSLFKDSNNKVLGYLHAQNFGTGIRFIREYYLKRVRLFGSSVFAPPPSTLCPPTTLCYYIVNHHEKIRHVLLGGGGCKNNAPTRVEQKNSKICKISGQKLVFSPQISYVILRWNAVNAVKLCKFTAWLSGDLAKIHHNSPLKYVISPPLQGSEPLTSCMPSTSSSTAPSLTNFYYFLFEYKSNSLYFLQNMRGESL